MSNQHFFKVAFAASGDVAAIPDDAQVDGSISYTEGYGLDYELDPTSDPDAKRIERTKFNELQRAITENVQQYQYWGIPEFVTAAQNGGTPVAYGKGAMVLYDTGGGVFQAYGSLVQNNTALPGSDPTKWRPLDIWSDTLIATAPDYVTPSSNALVTSPGRLATATREGRLTYGAATRVGAAYSLTLPGSAFTLVAGAQVDFTVPDVSPAGPLTLKVGALATVALQTNTETDPAAADLQPGRVYSARYSGSKWLLVQAVTSQLAPPVVLPDRLSGQSSAQTDYNNAIENGWYRAEAGVTNGPAALADTPTVLQVFASGTTYLTQIARAISGQSESNTRTYQRTRIAGTWGPWYRLYQTSVEQQQVSTPPGAMMHYAGSSAPNGWLVRNGAAVSRTTYANLFAVIGTLYGAGDGSTTFNLPNALQNGGVFDRAGTPDGAYYADTVGPHTHVVQPPSRDSEGGAGYTVTGNTGTGETLFPYSTQVNAGTETAPRHMLGLPIIKY